MGKSAQKNPPGKSPGKSSKIYTAKILQHISADWPGQLISEFSALRERAKKPGISGHYPLTPLGLAQNRAEKKLNPGTHVSLVETLSRSGGQIFAGTA